MKVGAHPRGAVPALVAIALAGAAQAGMSETYDCVYLRSCNAEGVCARASGTVSFDMTPRKVDRHGEGTYTLRRAGKAHTAYAASDIGPIMWAEGNSDMQIMTMTDADHAMWQRMDLKAETSEIRFLRCEER